jgi:hypothetical protein
VPAVAAPAPAFWARRLGVDKAAVYKELFKSGHRFRQQGVCVSGGGTRLFAQPLLRFANACLRFANACRAAFAETAPKGRCSRRASS